MKLELISFETAKLAKEKDVCLPCLSSYSELDPESAIAIEKGWEYTLNTGQNEFSYNGTDLSVYDAPAQSLLQKWLREKHNMSVEVQPYTNSELFFSVDVVQWNGILLMHRYGKDKFNTYVQALEKGLIEGLKLIK